MADMADKTKHSNDEIFELLSSMAVDIEELKKDPLKKLLGQTKMKTQL